jgi:beta-phosphoglucomutase-like phosphatase (HAD superfamily)
MVTGSYRKSVRRALSPERERCFDVVITADEVVRHKPDPEVFLFAAKEIQVSPANCLVIENAPFGIHAARAAGCGVIGMCTTLAREDLREANWIVQNHHELEILLSGKRDENA